LRAGILVLMLAGPAWAFEPFVVKDIRVEGIQRIEAGTVFNYLPVKVGDRMTDEKAAAAIRALFATGFFRDVRLEVQGNILIVGLEERPAIASVEFSGMKEFEKDKVKQSLRDVGFQEGRIFDRALLDQADALDAHAALDRLDHVVDRQAGHGDRGQRFHLNPCATSDFHAGTHHDPWKLAVRLEIQRNLRDRQRMTKRNELVRAFRRHDARKAGNAEHVAFLCITLDDQIECACAHDDVPFGYG